MTNGVNRGGNIMKNSIKVLLVSLFVLIIVAACGNNDNGNGSTSQSNGKSGEGEPIVAIQGDTINSHEVEDAICVVNSRFEQGWRMVFRASVKDATTGESIDDAEVKVVLEDGQEFEMEYGDHGTDDVETMLYTIAWSIPEDYPTGTLEYKYVATVDGEEYEFEPFDVDLSKMTIIEAS